MESGLLPLSKKTIRILGIWVLRSLSSDPFDGPKDDEEVTYPAFGDKCQRNPIGADTLPWAWASRWSGHEDLAILQQEFGFG